MPEWRPGPSGDLEADDAHIYGRELYDAECLAATRLAQLLGQDTPLFKPDELEAAASAWRGRTVVQPSVCLKKRNACSTVKRRKYQRQSALSSAGSGPPIQASHNGRGGSFLLGRRSTCTRITLNGASGAPPTCRSVQASICTLP